MHIIQAFLLWFFISSLMIGGAFAFRCFFPRESPWFGFIVPPLAFVILLNFIEHFVDRQAGILQARAFIAIGGFLGGVRLYLWDSLFAARYSSQLGRPGRSQQDQ